MKKIMVTKFNLNVQTQAKILIKIVFLQSTNLRNTSKISFFANGYRGRGHCIVNYAGNHGFIIR